MALFIDVARGNADIVAERRAWLEPFWPADQFGEYIARGLLAEHALWQGDPDTRAGRGRGHAQAAQADLRRARRHRLIRVAAVGLAAHGRPGRAGPGRRVTSAAANAGSRGGRRR